VGTQAQFRKKKPPVTYRYDSSLSPALDRDGQNPAREQGEWLIATAMEAARLEPPHEFLTPREFKDAQGRVVASVRGLIDALEQLRRLGKPFLDWAGKAERLSFDVPTLPLFVHERLSTQAIIDTLRSHKKPDRPRMIDLFADPEHSIADQVLKAYEYRDQWVNRMVLGDSLVVMNSLLHYENLGGQVQMIYMDPPYGIKYGSNFQPFVRRRDVKHNDDGDMTREPEMVQAYRDTWEIGLHSYLTCMRDRLLLCRELLAPTGSIFVQISDENLHHVRELMDEVFGPENSVSVITFSKTSGSTEDYLSGTSDYLLFYAKDIEKLKYRQPHVEKGGAGRTDGPYSYVQLADGTRRRMSTVERLDRSRLPKGARIYRLDNLQSQSMGREKGQGSACWFPVDFKGSKWLPGQRSRWKTNEEGMEGLKKAGRLECTETGLYYVRFLDDFPVQPIGNNWDDTSIAGFASDKLYVVQTTTKVVQRCLLMATDPGDLVFDPTCGSGTTAFVAEHWGRRWVTCDVSRVPLALARQRLLTATFPWYDLNDEDRGPAGGFVYKRKQNKKGEGNPSAF
jgi:adenine-specific DNA-methyltransferase